MADHSKQPVKFSIVTVCRNAENNIEKTLQSVISQTHDSVEYIVIDGASTDSTLKIIDKYKSRISHLASEPDKGIYDAMNKGIAAATGDYVFFLNAGDSFISQQALQKINEIINNDKAGIDILHGKVWVFDSANLWGYVSGVEFVSDRILFLDALPHQATFIRRTLLNEKNYDISYKISADYEWFVYAHVVKKYRFKYADIIVSLFDPHGVSADANSMKRRLHERALILKKYYSSFHLKGMLLFHYMKALKYPEKKRSYVMNILNQMRSELNQL